MSSSTFLSALTKELEADYSSKLVRVLMGILVGLRGTFDG